MSHLTPGQRESLQRQLGERSSVLRNEIASALRRSDDPGAAALANHLEEIDDEAVADLETGIEIAEIERDMRELRRAKDALRRLHSPEFGICADCGAEIPFARLSAEPTATRCLACQTKAERTRAG
ncbi:MAG: TraR/DksA family transcriptional regulator [Burkholderiales bacterium]